MFIVFLVILVLGTCLISGKVTMTKTTNTTVSTVQCESQSNMHFSFKNITSNNNTLIAECDILEDTPKCHLSDPKLGEYYAISYIGGGGYLIIIKENINTRGTYTCCERFNSTNCDSTEIGYVSKESEQVISGPDIHVHYHNNAGEPSAGNNKDTDGKQESVLIVAIAVPCVAIVAIVAIVGIVYKKCPLAVRQLVGGRNRSGQATADQTANPLLQPPNDIASPTVNNENSNVSYQMSSPDSVQMPESVQNPSAPTANVPSLAKDENKQPPDNVLSAVNTENKQPTGNVLSVVNTENKQPRDFEFSGDGNNKSQAIVDGSAQTPAS